jgi:hypothetical protein
MLSHLLGALGYAAGALAAAWMGRPRRCAMTTCRALLGERHTIACIARRAGWGEDVEDEARAAGLGRRDR